MHGWLILEPTEFVAQALVAWMMELPPVSLTGSNQPGHQSLPNTKI
jgi:hypothetical protein